jgi:2-isopropylmalate synthase
MTSARTIRSFDTTLRDGEQSPGASMNLTEKMEIAQALQQLGVNAIEAGFPIVSPGDSASVKEIAATIARRPIALRTRPVQRRRHRPRPGRLSAGPSGSRIDVFLGHQFDPPGISNLRMTEDEVGGPGRRRCPAGRQLLPRHRVFAGGWPAQGTELDFLCRVVEAAIDAGATTVNIPDTVGYAHAPADAPCHQHPPRAGAGESSRRP